MLIILTIRFVFFLMTEECYGFTVRFRDIFRLDKYLILFEVLTALLAKRANCHRRFGRS
jgi:hypothetical protein